MRCPQCLSEDRRSRVAVGATFATGPAVQPYYDEDGVYHYCDPKTYTTHYQCSNGHTWTASHRSSSAPPVSVDPIAVAPIAKPPVVKTVKPRRRRLRHVRRPRS